MIHLTLGRQNYRELSQKIPANNQEIINDSISFHNSTPLLTIVVLLSGGCVDHLLAATTSGPCWRQRATIDRGRGRWLAPRHCSAHRSAVLVGQIGCRSAAAVVHQTPHGKAVIGLDFNIGAPTQHRRIQFFRFRWPVKCHKSQFQIRSFIRSFLSSTESLPNLAFSFSFTINDDSRTSWVCVGEEIKEIKS